MALRGPATPIRVEPVQGSDASTGPRAGASARMSLRRRRQKKLLLTLGHAESYHTLSHITDSLAPVPVPVFSECVVGLRYWAFDALARLRPLVIDFAPWLPGVNTAVCEAVRGRRMGMLMLPYLGDMGHDESSVPARGCECGFYGFFDELPHVKNVSYDLDQPRRLVAGAIAAWGDIQVHHSGFRAQHACVTALAADVVMPHEILDLVATAAERYGVPVVTLDDLPTEAQLHGDTLPPGIRPPKSPYGLFLGG